MHPRWLKIEFYSEILLHVCHYEEGLFNKLLSIIPDFPAQGTLELCFAEVKKKH